ncbi:MAG: hydroxymethylglutaryl-CoA lyase [Gaiellaceae bacterium]
MQITLCDVGPRDGLQNESGVLAPAVRADLVNRLAAAGLPRVEAASFVRPDLVPQMGGAEEVAALIERRDGVEYSGLVLNRSGYERLVGTALDRVTCTVAATESFSRRNANASLEQAVGRVVGILEASERPTTVTIGCAWGCPFEGEVAPEQVLELAEQLTDADEIVLADTIGVATPGRVGSLIGQARNLGRPVGGHFHNTRNTGFANAWAALGAGATLLDASVGGLGGCPFAPRATGNVATEDLIYLLEREGVQTGVDLDALIGVAEWLEGVLGRELPGQVYRAGAFA